MIMCETNKKFLTANSFGLDTVNNGDKNRTALQAAIIEAERTGSSILIEESNEPYLIEGDVDFSLANTSLSGCGNHTFLQFIDGGLRISDDVYSEPGRIQENTGLNNLTFSRFGTPGPAILWESDIESNNVRATWNNIHIADSSGDGLAILGNYLLTVHGLWIRRTDGDGISINQGTKPTKNQAGGNAIAFFGGEVQSADWGVRAEDTQSVTFHGYTFENNRSGGIRLDSDNRSFAVFGGYFESNARDNPHANNQNNENCDIYIANGSLPNTCCSFYACNFEDGGIAHRHSVYLEDGNQQILIDNPQFDNYGAAPIRLQSGIANTTTGQVRMGCIYQSGVMANAMISANQNNFIRT